MKVALISNNWNFMHPIKVALLQRGHEAMQYIPSNLETLNLVNLVNLINWADVAYFDFAQSPLIELSNLTIKPCKYVVRMLGIEVFHTINLVNWNAVDHVLFISEHQKERFLEHVKSPYAKELPLTPIPLGVNVDMFTIPEHKELGFNICQVGNMLPHKRHYETIQLFRELIDKSPPHFKWQLTIHHTTTGTWRKEMQHEYTVFCKELVEILDLTDRVTFESYDPDWVKGGGAKFFARQDIVISNSHMEGYHCTPMEGMAAGCMPLINCWRGSAQIYPPQYVFKTFGEAIHKLLWWGELSIEAKQQYAQAHREYAVKYGDEKVHAQKICEIIEQVGGNHITPTMIDLETEMTAK